MTVLTMRPTRHAAFTGWVCALGLAVLGPQQSAARVVTTQAAAPPQGPAALGRSLRHRLRFRRHPHA